MTKNKRLLTILLLLLLVTVTLTVAACMINPVLVVTYDSTHEVYVGDDISSLRPYLTVKYTNNIGLLSVVDNYRLYGTLTEGESTVYVRYQGVVESVNITVLPKKADDGDDDNDQKDDDNSVTIQIATTSNSIVAGDSIYINVSTNPAGQENQVNLELLQGQEYGYLNGNTFHAVAAGECVIVGKIGDVVSNQLEITVTKKSTLNVTITLSISTNFIERNSYAHLSVNVSPSSYEDQVQYRFITGEDCVTRYGVSLRGDSSGIVTVQAYIEDCVSNTVTLQVVANDPYENVNSNWFYMNYSPADSLEDAYWRTKHNLMSGSIDEQDQKPSTSTNQPTSANKFVRNNDTNYVDNGNTWEVVDNRNNVVNRIYKFGAYVTLEEVAAYVYAFGDVPANYTASNKTSSLNGSPWGKYLRLNHNYFSGDNSKYPYEPALPRVSGIGNGDLRYYEIDIGTTGTDCDPSYDSVIYNDGDRIVRGAARIVYSRYYRDGNYDGDHIDNLEERYVFYTYNHYNDFQEYLNYQGGWGKIFGNITGNGTISSKTNYNPTPYVEVTRLSFNTLFK